MVSASATGALGLPRDAVGQRLALDEFQHERATPSDFFDSVDRGDVRVIQRREHARFALEPRQAIGIAGEQLAAGS